MALLVNGCRCSHLAIVSETAIPEADILRVVKYGVRYFIKSRAFENFYDWLVKVEQRVLTDYLPIYRRMLPTKI